MIYRRSVNVRFHFFKFNLAGPADKSGMKTTASCGKAVQSTGIRTPGGMSTVAREDVVGL